MARLLDTSIRIFKKNSGKKIKNYWKFLSWKLATGRLRIGPGALGGQAGVEIERYLADHKDATRKGVATGA